MRAWELSIGHQKGLCQLSLSGSPGGLREAHLSEPHPYTQDGEVDFTVHGDNPSVHKIHGVVLAYRRGSIKANSSSKLKNKSLTTAQWSGQFDVDLASVFSYGVYD